MRRSLVATLMSVAACAPSAQPIADAPTADVGDLPPVLSEARKVLWIGAHPDDELVAAPLLGRLCNGTARQCTLLVFTRGEGGNCGRSGGCVPDLATVRALELERSAALFPAGVVAWDLGNEAANTPEDAFANFVSHAGSEAALLAQVEGELRRLAPDVIITFDPRNGVTCHPDHRAAAAVALAVARDVVGIPASRLFMVSSRIDGVGLTSDPESLEQSPWLGFAPRAPGLQAFDGTIAIPSLAAPAWSIELGVLRAHQSQYSTAVVSKFESAPASAQIVPYVTLDDATDAPGHVCP